MKLTIEVYKDVDKQWRWRFIRKAFGKTFIVADSAEAYRNKKDCLDALTAITKTIMANKFLVVL